MLLLFVLRVERGTALKAIDPGLWLTAVLAIIGMTFAGVLPPALRASRVDPVTVLKAE